MSPNVVKNITLTE